MYAESKVAENSLKLEMGHYVDAIIGPNSFQLHIDRPDDAWLIDNDSEDLWVGKSESKRFHRYGQDPFDINNYMADVPRGDVPAEFQPIFELCEDMMQSGMECRFTVTSETYRHYERTPSTYIERHFDVQDA